MCIRATIQTAKKCLPRNIFYRQLQKWYVNVRNCLTLDEKRHCVCVSSGKIQYISLFSRERTVPQDSGGHQDLKVTREREAASAHRENLVCQETMASRETSARRGHLGYRASRAGQVPQGETVSTALRANRGSLV